MSFYTGGMPRPYTPLELESRTLVLKYLTGLFDSGEARKQSLALPVLELGTQLVVMTGGREEARRCLEAMIGYLDYFEQAQAEGEKPMIHLVKD